MMTKTQSVEDLIYKPLSGEWGDDVGKTKVIRTTNFTNDGTLDLTDVVERDIDSRKIERKKLEYGDTIIEKSGGSPSQPVGRVVYFDVKDGIYLCNNFTSVIRSKENLDSRYLFWFLYSNHLSQNTRKYQNKTTGIINLQLERYIKELQIPVPPLPIQKRIAEILDSADALKRKDQELLEKYDGLAQAIFIDMFGDPVKNEKGVILSELIKINPSKSELKVNTNIEVSFVPMKSVGEEGEFDASDIRDYSSVSSGFTYFKENDVLFAKITPCMENGKGAIAKDLKNNIGFGSTEFHVLRPNEILNSSFLFHLTKLQNFRTYAESNMSGSAGQKRVPTSFFSKIKIDTDKLNNQVQFEKTVSNISLSKKHLLNQSIDSTNLFNSLIQKAFKGELIS